MANVETTKARGEWIDPALGRRTFASWVDEWSVTIFDLRPSTLDRDLRAICKHLIPRFGRVPLAKITNPMVRAFIADMLTAETHAQATVRKIGQIMSKVMRDAVEAGLIPRSPCDGVRLPVEPRRQMRFLSADQVAQLAEAAGPDYSTLIFTAATPVFGGASSPAYASSG